MEYAHLLNEIDELELQLKEAFAKHGDIYSHEARERTEKMLNIKKQEMEEFQVEYAEYLV